jgi:hypothetical protein
LKILKKFLRQNSSNSWLYNIYWNDQNLTTSIEQLQPELIWTDSYMQSFLSQNLTRVVPSVDMKLLCKAEIPNTSNIRHISYSFARMWTLSEGFQKLSKRMQPNFLTRILLCGWNKKSRWDRYWLWWSLLSKMWRYEDLPD